jgi:hypothetical protein
MTPEQREDHCNALRDRLWIGRQANYESLDKSILTLSSGALALSVTFIKDLVPIAASVWSFALYVSWLMFVLAIISTLASALVSQAAHERQLENVESYRGGTDDLEAKNNPCITGIKWLNRASATFFFIGLVAMWQR